jgi:hypothetical protein
MIEGVLGSLCATVIASLAVLAFRNREWLQGLAVCLFYSKSRQLRVSVSVILRMSQRERLILIRMPRRREAFGPIGGVIKFYDAARGRLSEMGFVAQPEAGGASVPFDDDLRGFMPAASIFRFYRWFKKGIDRESVTDCLRRELREELAEIGAGHLLANVDGLRFRPLRTVKEGPMNLGPAYAYLQLRLFYVYDLVTDERSGRKFAEEIFAIGSTNKDLLVVNSEDVVKGRTDKGLIGSHACYLLAARALRPDLPPL